jgi:hypothetical protein
MVRPIQRDMSLNRKTAKSVVRAESVLDRTFWREEFRLELRLILSIWILLNPSTGTCRDAVPKQNLGTRQSG